MSFGRTALAAAIARHGWVARIVVAESQGSAPREPGAAMLVRAGGQDGTIGGGALEYEAVARARILLAKAQVAASAASGGSIWTKRSARAARVDRLPLGPALGQCCGGAVVLVTEVWDAAALAALPVGPVVARAVAADAGDMPFALRRITAKARSEGIPAPVRLTAGWLVEPEDDPRREIWVWGAGHVGRAIVAVLAPLPGLAITWVDTAPERFPESLPEGVTRLAAADPALLVPHAPKRAEHLILTFSHALDLELCHRLLAHGFARCGLIGSRTKWARFRNRLAALGHSPAQISGIACPIGDPALGKHPQAIAVGVAAGILRTQAGEEAATEATGESAG